MVQKTAIYIISETGSQRKREFDKFWFIFTLKMYSILFLLKLITQSSLY